MRNDVFYLISGIFIQAASLMSVFEQRLSFRMIYFKINEHKIIVKCRWGSGGALSSAVSSWHSLGVVSGAKGSDLVFLHRESK